MAYARLVAATAVLAFVSGCATTTNGSGSGGPSKTRTTRPSSSASTSQPPSSSTPEPTPSTTVPTSKVIPPPAVPLRIVGVSTTISGKSYTIKVWVDRKDPTCADHAYGTAIVNFLKAHPCSGLQRLLATTTVNGRGVGIAESRLGFLGQADASYQTASDFIKLVSAEGTGNITDLLSEGYRLPSGPSSVPSPDAFNAIGQDAGVSVDDMWYLDGPTPSNDPPLVQMSRDIFLQFF